MKRAIRLGTILLFPLAIGTAAQAAPIATTVTAASDTPFTGDIAVLTDGFIPGFEQYYRDNSVSTDYGSPPLSFNFAFNDGAQLIRDLLVSVDNNDDYSVAFYNGATLVQTVTVTAAQGAAGTGFDTFATFAPVPNSGTQIDGFAPFLATSALVTGYGGDAAYGIGEVQFFAAAVPEPASWAMMVGGFALAGAAMRRRRANVTLRYA